MKTTPLVSIIMPSFNRATLIKDTVESISRQTYSNWELLIMDDGSDDDTAQIIAQINDRRIQFYKMQRTGHVSKLKNTAIDKARGEMIAFIDSDDLWAATKLEKQVAALEQFPEAGFCVTGGYTFKKQDEPVEYLYKQREGMRSGNFLTAMFRSELSGFTQALLLRKRCLPVSGYFNESKLFSDADFILNLACHHKGVLLYEPLFFRRLHYMSDSDEHWEKRYAEWANVIRQYRNKNQLSSSEATQALFKLYINFGVSCLEKSTPIKAMGNFYKAWVHKPFSIIPVKKMAKSVLYLFK